MKTLFPCLRPGLVRPWPRRSTALLVTILLTRFLPAAALAAPALPPVPNPLSLAAARQVAAARNWDLLASVADVDLALARGLMAGEFPNPTLAVSVVKIPADASQPAGTMRGNGLLDRSYDTVAAFNQLIEIGGKRSARKGSAAAGRTAAAARLAEVGRQLDLAVTRAYVGALLADETARVQRDSAESLQREAGIAAARLKAGDISAADATQIDIAARRLVLDARAADNAAASARVQLSVLLGLGDPASVPALGDTLVALDAAGMAPAGSDPNTLAPDGSRLGSAVSPTPAGPGASGAILRPDLAAAIAELQRAESDLKLARAQRIPDPTFMVQYEHEPPDQPHTIGVGVQFPLPLWNRNRGAIAAAQAGRDQAALNVRKVTAAAAAELVQSRRDLETARGRRDEYLKTIGPQSASVRQSVTYAYEKGGASLLDLLAAQRTDNETRLATAQAQADVAIAAATLAAARVGWTAPDFTHEKSPSPPAASRISPP